MKKWLSNDSLPSQGSSCERDARSLVGSAGSVLWFYITSFNSNQTGAKEAGPKLQQKLPKLEPATSESRFCRSQGATITQIQSNLRHFWSQAVDLLATCDSVDLRLYGLSSAAVQPFIATHRPEKKGSRSGPNPKRPRRPNLLKRQPLTGSSSQGRHSDTPGPGRGKITEAEAIMFSLAPV